MSSIGVSGPAKLQAVTTLVNKLTEDLKSQTLSPEERDKALEELKVYGRDPRFADPIFTKQGIETLTKHAFDSPSESTSRNALRVLCNAMLLKPETRQGFVDLGYESKACEKLKNDSWDDEFLATRVIFFSTYGTTVDLAKLIDEHHLAESIVANLSRHASRMSEHATNKTKPDPMELMALGETLRLLFNVTSKCPSKVDAFTAAVPHIVALLLSVDMPPKGTPPLEAPLGPLVNALMNLKLDSEEVRSCLYPKDAPSSLAEKLIKLLDLSLTAYPDQELDATVTPLVCIISAMYENAPAASPVRDFIRKSLLPSEEERTKVLGKGDTLPARLLVNMTNPIAPELAKAVSHLLFNVSDKDAHTFVESIGYGYASGFLFQNNIPVPQGLGGGDDEKGTSSKAGQSSKRAVNPITGQFLDTETFPDMPEMTMEEKEREAERLFVLFERARKLGIVNVENPVAKAVQEGRFEELPDDYEEDSD